MKRAILTISFGTSLVEQLERSIQPIVKAVEKAYKEYDVFLAFSSEVIIKKLKKEYNLSVLSVKEALEQLKEEQYEEVLVQPLHLLSGKEYHKVLEQCREYKQYYTMKIGTPLLSEEEDYASIVRELKTLYDTGESFLLFMGHGTTYEANDVYEKLGDEVKRQRVLGSVSTLERIDQVNAIVELAKRHKKNAITVIPFMLVAGRHVIKDIMGMEQNKWEGALSLRGLNVTIIERGLGECSAVQELFIKHIEKAFIKMI